MSPRYLQSEILMASDLPNSQTDRKSSKEVISPTHHNTGNKTMNRKIFNHFNV